MRSSGPAPRQRSENFDPEMRAGRSLRSLLRELLPALIAVDPDDLEEGPKHRAGEAPGNRHRAHTEATECPREAADGSGRCKANRNPNA